MRSFTKNELIGVAIILAAVGFFFAQGIQMSLLRARDSQRMGDLNTVSNALFSFYEEYGFFPSEEDGRIKACKADNFDSVVQTLESLPAFDRTLFESGLRACIWGEDSFAQTSQEEKSAFPKLPRDPQTKDGLSYTYFSNGNRFQLFAHLESDDDFYDPSVFARKLSCGSEICNVGKSYASTPLDRSIEEYEQELLKGKNTGGK
jgi:hypothetical protein